MDGEHWGFAGTRLLTGQARLRVVFTGGETLYGEIVRSAAAARAPARRCSRAVAGLVSVLVVAATALCLVLGRRPPPAGPRLARRAAERGHARRGRAARGVPGGLHVLPGRRRLPARAAAGPRAPRRLRREHRPRRPASARTRRARITEGRLRVSRIAAGAGRLRAAAARRGRARPRGARPAIRSTRAILDAARGAAARPAARCRRDLPVHRGSPPRDGRRPGRRRRAARRDQGLARGRPRACATLDDAGARQLERARATAGRRRAQGDRLRLAVARRRRHGPAASPIADYRFAGLLVCEDPVREGVAEAVRAVPRGGDPHDHGDRRPPGHGAGRRARDRSRCAARRRAPRARTWRCGSRRGHGGPARAWT